MHARPMHQPDHIEGYAIDSPLGSTASGSSFLAQCTANDQWSVLEVLRHSDPGLCDRLAGVPALNLSTHPGILPIKEVLTYKGHPTLVTDFVEGPSLEGWLDTHRPDLDEAMGLFRQLVEAVAHAHQQGVVHGDLHPQLVVVQPQGPDRWRTKIKGWGLAAALNPPADRFGGMTTIHTTLRRAGYTAPECLSDAEQVGPPADVFSLGCLLYELTCGVAPFAGLPAYGALLAARQGDFKDPLEQQPDLPPSVAGLIRRTLLAEPDRRPAHAGELLIALDELPKMPSAGQSPLSIALWLLALAAPPAIGLGVGALVAGLRAIS